MCIVNEECGIAESAENAADCFRMAIKCASSSEHSGLDVLMISEISMVGVPAAAALPVIVSSSSVSVSSMIVGGISVVIVLSVGAATGTVYVSVGAAVSAA